jgi:hypothetical protein
VLGNSVISSVARVVLGSIELFPIFPNKSVWSKEKMPWPQKGTASFINDIGNLAVESVPQYPFGHTIKVVADSGYNSYYETSAGSHDVILHKKPTHSEALYHDPDSNIF